MFPANVTVGILEVNLAQITVTSVTFDMLPNNMHIMIIYVSTKGDSTLKANPAMATFHKDSICRHVTTYKALGWRVVFFGTLLIIIKIHPTFLAYFKLRLIEDFS